MQRYELHAEKQFRRSLRKYVAAGAPAMRGMSKEEYIRSCQSLWDRCKTDRVYKAKMFFEPLVDKQFAEQSDDIFCALVARSDPDGRLIDAPLGYHRSEEKGIYLSRVVIGSPYGVDAKRPAKSKIETYLFAYFDILGFKSTVKRENLEKVHRMYLRLIDEAVQTQRDQFSKKLALNSSGDLVPAIMFSPFEVAYASDSLILYVPYHPNFVEEFLRRSALLFCLALRAHVPLRGVITAGTGVFHAKTNVFLGPPLVEASSLEQELEWVGVAFGKSIDGLEGLPLPPDLIQLITPPTTTKGETLFAELVLDWPRVWRTTFSDSAIPYLAGMDEEAERDPSLEGTTRDRIQARYEHAAIFFEFSEMNQNWFIPKGWTMSTTDDVFKNPLEGADLSFLHRDPRYQLCFGGFSIGKHLESLKSWVASFNPVDIEVWDHNLNHALFRPSPNAMKRSRG